MDLEERTKNGVIRGQPSPLGWLQYKPLVVVVAVYVLCYSLQWPGTCRSSHADSVWQHGHTVVSICLWSSLSHWFKPWFVGTAAVSLKNSLQVHSALICSCVYYQVLVFFSVLLSHLETSFWWTPYIWVFWSSFCRIGTILGLWTLFTVFSF